MSIQSKCYNSRQVREYKQSLQNDRELFPMLKTLKLLRAIVVNVGIFIVSGYSLYLGADPTLIGLTAILVAGAYNGLEISDYLALVEAVQQVKDDQ